MELCEASRHPVLALGRSGSLPPKGSQRARIKSHPPSVSLQLPTCNDSIPSPIQINNSLQRSTVSPRKACVGMCKVFWTIEADIEDDHKLFITGDLVTLGCWDINMAVPLFPSKENACLWRTEVEIPSGMHFKYNYFVKRDDQLSHRIVWRPGPEFSLSVPMANMQSEVIVVRDMWLNKPCLTPSISCWTSWLHEAMYVTEEVENVGHYLPRGKKKMVQRSKMNEASAGEISVADILNEEVVLSVEKDAKSGADPRNAFCELQQPVEEPWLHRSTLSFASDFSLVSKACDHLDKKNDARTLKDLEKETEKIEDVDEHKVAPDKGSVSTVILINSSVCTMQRIAILEDAKLVELLLEPVKNNVQCDSVYLGVVTKLVPHMGGAFVDIGISRPSLMDIKPNREPFVYPPFDTLTIGQELNGSINTEQVTSEHEQNLTDDENVADEFLVDDHVEESTDSTHLMHANIDKREFEDSLYDMNNDDGTEADLDVFYPENGHHMQIENVETPYPSNLEGPDSSELSVLLQDPADSAVKRSRGNKWARVRKGTKVIVQVVKEGLGTKGPALSAYPNLKSRFWILIARCDRIGVSKKIIGAERTRLRVIAKTLQPTGFGLTVRTVAAGHSLEELQKDLQGLLSTWKGIIEHAKSAALAADEGVEGAVPVILHRAMGQTLSVVQDYFNDKVKSMIVDSHRTYHEVSNYLQEIAPDLCDRVVLYNKRTPLFDEYGIEEEINNILSKRVPLSNGGSLVIEQTEALVSIDVNGGQSMLGQCTSQEKAVLEVNLSAAKQIARELRLRDVGGIIVVDFIDMIDEANKRLVYEEVKKAVERDKSMVKVSELSRHGLMEITRKRVRPSVSFLISEPCPCCQGTGRVEALETSFSRIEHEICRLLAASGHKSDPENANSWPRFVLKVDRYMCNYLTSGKKTKLAFLSSSLKVWIFLKVARGFPRGAFELKPYLDDKTNEENPAIISKLHSAEARSYIPNSKLTLFPVKKWKSRGK